MSNIAELQNRYFVVQTELKNALAKIFDLEQENTELKKKLDIPSVVTSDAYFIEKDNVKFEKAADKKFEEKEDEKSIKEALKKKKSK